MYTQVLSVRFTATKSGTYDVHVAFGRDLVKNAPFRIAVFEYAHGHLSVIMSVSASSSICVRERVALAARCTCTSMDIQVQPGPRHLPSSTVSGSGLSLATAGVATHVVLTVHQEIIAPAHENTHAQRKRAHTNVRTRKRRCETSTQTGGPNPTSRRQALLSQYSSLQQAAEDRPCRLLPRQ